LADLEGVVQRALQQVQDRPARASTRARRILLVVVSFVFTLFLIEFPALVNIVDYKMILGSTWENLDISDPELLQIHRPHAHSSGVMRGGNISLFYRLPPSDLTLFRWDEKYDRNGFRNDLDLKSADMVVIGDSFVEGQTVPKPGLTTSLLARMRGEVVANLGQKGYGPQQELVVLKRYGLPLQPRTVVWMFFEGNDLMDVIGYRNAIGNQSNLWQNFVRRSFTRSAIRLVVRRFFTPAATRPGVKRSGVIQGQGKTLTIYFLRPSVALTGGELSALDETTRIIATGYNLCAAQGARFIFVFIPDKFRAFHNSCTFPEASECRNWVVNDLPERMRKAVTSIAPDIGYVDLTPNFIDAVRRGEVPYYSDDLHWTPEGHKIAADTINDYLLSMHKGSLPN
jgi:hypothetical protein